MLDFLKSGDQRLIAAGDFYIRGVVDAEQQHRVLHRLNGMVINHDPSNPSENSEDAKFLYPMVCFGKGKISTLQARDMFVKYLDENPDNRHAPAAFLVRRMLVEKFPCKLATSQDLRKNTK